MIGWQELLIILVIVVLLFGTKKLTSIGADLGGALKGFKKAIKEEEPPINLEKQDATFKTAANTETATESAKNKES